jgi:hypothetical protein
VIRLPLFQIHMSINDGKNQFYKKLQLDEHTMKTIRQFREIKRFIDRDTYIDDSTTDRRRTTVPGRPV